MVEESELLPDPGDYDPDTASRTLAEWLNAWREQDFNLMAELSQRTWCSNHPNPAQRLRALYGNRTIVGIKMGEAISVEESLPHLAAASRDIPCSLSMRFRGLLHQGGMLIRVVKETGVFTPSSKYPASPGTWGVNPLSAILDPDERKKLTTEELTAFFRRRNNESASH